MSIQQEISKPVTDDYLELFRLDLSALGGSVYYFTPTNYTTTQVLWQGNVYVPFPIQFEGLEWDGSTQAPPRPTATISNVGGVLLLQVITLGDLVGGTLSRWRTFKKFLDGQSAANPNAYLQPGPDTYFIEQKTSHDKEYMQFSLASPLDLDNVNLPRRQVLKDDIFGDGSSYFPGVMRSSSQ